MTAIKIGDPIPSVEVMETLPVGAAVTMKTGSKVLTKHEGGWAYHGRERQDPGSTYWFEGMTLISTPEPYIGPRIGEEVTTVEQLAALPIGTVIAASKYPQHRAQRGGAHGDDNNGYWYDISHGSRAPAELLAAVRENGPWVVESRPDPYGETVKQFAWRFRDIVLLGAERAGQGANRALKVLDRMDLPFKPSVGLRITSQHDRANLPQGTRVFTGNPEKFDSFGVYVKRGAGWTTVLAGPNALDPINALAVVVDEVEGKTEPDAWLTRSGREDDPRKISLFRAKAWEEGYQEKVAKGWCSEFERVMVRAGVTANSPMEVDLNGFKIGDIVTPEQAATLPLGVILSPVDGGIAWFERVENSTNRAGTRQVDGLDYSGHFSKSMKIISPMGPVQSPMKDRDGRWRCSSAEFMQALPVGTIIGSDADRYRKELDRRNGEMVWSRCPRQAADLDTWDEPALGTMDVHYNNSAYSPGPNCNFSIYRMGARA